MQSYASRSCGLDELDESLAKDLTDVEKHLMGTQDLMRVRGKVCTQRNMIFLCQRNMHNIFERKFYNYKITLKYLNWQFFLLHQLNEIDFECHF